MGRVVIPKRTECRRRSDTSVRSKKKGAIVDPNFALMMIREIIKDYEAGNSADVHTIIECFNALDQWMSKGGFLPNEWKEKSK